MKNKAVAAAFFDGTGLLISLVTLIGMFLFADSVRTAVKSALSLCAFSLIPALFPYMVLSRLCVTFMMRRTGVLHTGKRKDGTHAVCAVAVALGWLSGFPGGAVLASSLYKSGSLTKKEAEAVAAIADSVSPSFCFFVFGRSVLHSTWLGVIVYIAVLLSALIHCFVILLLRKLNLLCESRKNSQNNIIPLSPVGSSPQSVPEIIASSAITMLYVCAFVVFFSSFSTVCLQVVSRCVPIAQDARATITGVFELSSGVHALNDLPFADKLRTGSLLCGFGGLSAMMQVAAVCREAGLSPRLFVVTRFSGALLTLLLTCFLILLLPDAGLRSTEIHVKTLLPSAAATVLLLFWIRTRKRSKT